MRWRMITTAALICAASAIALWVLHAPLFGHWLQVRTGTVNEPGPYYGFWSGFGSDLEEFGILGAIGAGIYQLVKKYNCHEPGCWRIGQHPAAGGQFLLCYRHHPDYQGRKPTHELIERLHREHLERQGAIHSKLDEVRQPSAQQLGSWPQSVDRCAAPPIAPNLAVRGGRPNDSRHSPRADRPGPGGPCADRADAAPISKTFSARL